jgi:hypothetical protein
MTLEGKKDTFKKGYQIFVIPRAPGKAAQNRCPSP